MKRLNDEVFRVIAFEAVDGPIDLLAIAAAVIELRFAATTLFHLESLDLMAARAEAVIFPPDRFFQERILHPQAE